MNSLISPSIPLFLYHPPSPPLSFRYLLYIKDKGHIYLVDRDNSVFSAPAIRFPARKKPGSHVTETLADSVR